MNIQPSVGRGHLTPPVPWLTALCIFCEEPLTICRGRRPRRPGQAYISFDICGQLRGRAASPLAAGEGIMLYSFRLCVGNHPSVRCADSFPQGKPNHRAGGSHGFSMASVAKFRNGQDRSLRSVFKCTTDIFHISTPRRGAQCAPVALRRMM